MYYLGKKNFCSMISSVKIADITSKTYGDFYPFIYEIEQAIIKKDFDRLISAREKLWQKYYVTFPFRNLGKLLIELMKLQ